MTDESGQEMPQEQAEGKDAAPDTERVSFVRWSGDIVHTDKDVTIRQGVVRRVRAHDVTMRQGAAVSIDADAVHVTQGTVAVVRSGEAQLGPGATSVAVLADNVKLDQAASQFMLARDNVEMDQSAVGILVGQQVTAKDSMAVLMFANSVEGDVRVAMDRQTAISFGAALGAVLGFVLLLGGLFRRRK